MAKRVVTELIDDIDGSNAVETLRFGFDGKAYTIDLSKKNANAFRKAVAPYLQAATVERSSPSKRASNRRDPNYLAEVRAWARKKGYDVADRGRVPAVVLQEFEASRR